MKLWSVIIGAFAIAAGLIIIPARFTMGKPVEYIDVLLAFSGIGFGIISLTVGVKSEK
jgi:hypothetical protein